VQPERFILTGFGSRLETSGFRLGAAALFLLGVAWLFQTWPWLSGAVTIPWDAKNHFYPMLRGLSAAIASGESPDWSPYHYAGHPMVADPQSLIFSWPYRLLAQFVAVPTFQHQDAVELLTLLAGGLGLVLFFREKGWGTAPGLLAAIVFTFGGPASARLQHVGQILSYAAIPFALWAAERLAARRSISSGLLLGLTGAALAVGRDQVALLGCFLVAAYLATRLLATHRDLLSTIPALAAAGVVAIALLIVPLGLTVAFAAMSNRPEITFFNAGLGSLHPAAFLSALIPDYFDARGFWEHYWGPGSPTWWSQWIRLDRALVELYAGTLPVVLLIGVGLCSGQLLAPGARFFLVAFLALLFYAVGRYTPAFRLFYDYIPGISLYRRPADATFLLVLCLGILSGYALHRLMQVPSAVFGGRAFAASLVVFAVLFGIAALVAQSSGKLGATLPALARGAVFILLAHALVGLIGWRPHWRNQAVLAALAFAAADGAWYSTASGLNSKPPAIYAELDPRGSDPLVEHLKAALRPEPSSVYRNRAMIFGISGPWQNAPEAHAIEAVLGYNPLRWGAYQRTVARSNNAHFGSHPFSPLFPGFNAPLPDMLGIREVVTPLPIERIDRAIKPGDMRLAAMVGKALIYENPNVFPRAFFAESWVQADFTTLIETGQWPNVDLTRTVVLDASPPPKTGGDAGMAKRVSITDYRNTDITVTVEAGQAGFLVLNDIWNPWWQAEVDGQPVPLLRANVLFRAVLVPAGRHEVRFRFRPVAGLFAGWWSKLKPEHPADSAIAAGR